MLKIVKNPEFTARVKVQVPTEGGVSEQSFMGRFRTISITEAETYSGFTSDGVAQWMRRILIGWEGVTDEDGNDVPFSANALDQLIDIPFVRNAISAAYNAAMLGAKRGN